MTDPRLRHLIEAAKALDDPNVSRERIAQIDRYCSILASGIHTMGLPTVTGEGGSDWVCAELADPVLGAALTLAVTTSFYASSLMEPSSSQWWRDHRKKMLSEWGAARRAAEMVQSGEISASTLNALSAAETRAGARTRTVASDDTPPPLLTRSDVPTAWSFD